MSTFSWQENYFPVPDPEIKVEKLESDQWKNDKSTLFIPSVQKRWNVPSTLPVYSITYIFTKRSIKVLSNVPTENGHINLSNVSS